VFNFLDFGNQSHSKYNIYKSFKMRVLKYSIDSRRMPTVTVTVVKLFQIFISAPVTNINVV